jgi:tartrate-resistant acid phosphatase type 5
LSIIGIYFLKMLSTVHSPVYKGFITMRRTLIIFLTISIFLSSCTKNAVEPAVDVDAHLSVGILIYGDTGYHPDYPDQDDYDDLFSPEEYVADEWEEWVDDKRPRSEYEPRPSAVSPVTGKVVPKSGIFGISKAMTNFCRHSASCDFGVLLGDNIYPSGATLGTDGFDDSQRFKDILQDPFGRVGDVENGYLTYVTLGNHDWETSRDGGFAQIEYLETAPGFYMDGPFYSVKPPSANGDVELFIIDTNMILANSTVREDTLNDDGSEGSLGVIEPPDYFVTPLTDAEKLQPAWLEDALKNSSAKWKFVIAHHPIWSSSGSKFEEARVLREQLMPVLCKYADAYLVGHEHTLEIHTDSCETALGRPSAKSLVQILSGAGAKQRPLHSSFMAHQESKYPEHKTVFAVGMLWGFSHMQIEGDTARVVMIGIPDDASETTTVLYEYEFERRSGMNDTH